MTLNEYFHLIVKQPPIKETTMFERQIDYIKSKWNELLNTRYGFTDEPDAVLEDSWAFEIHTSGYVSDGEIVLPQHDFIVDSNDGTWMDVLDQILDVLGKHYGYNIKEQVYYSVAFPLNQEGYAGYGRSLNDEVLQKLLLSYPEVYEVSKPE